jgi:hypothetical protein
MWQIMLRLNSHSQLLDETSREIRQKEVRTMRKIISLAVLLAVVALLLVTAVPALANGPLGYEVGPTLGGANNNTTHTPPGEPTVDIPVDNPAIVEDPLNPEPGDVFWSWPYN